MEELQFETPQDKLLVMLLERVSNLEEKLEKNNGMMEKILSLTTFKYFSISLSGKRSIFPEESRNDVQHSYFEDVGKYLFDFVKFIDERVPLTSAWVQYASNDRTICTLDRNEFKMADLYCQRIVAPFTL